MRAAWAVGLVALASCAGDPDRDGFRGDDCDSDDPLVYPGAPDDPGDGIDADCDGVDPGYRFVGTWVLSEIDASYFSLEALEPDGSSGLLVVGEDLSTELDLTVALAEDLLGFALVAPFELVGAASQIPGPDQFDLVLDGELLEEHVTADLGCGVVEEVVSCRGGLKALDINFDVSADFVRP